MLEYARLMKEAGWRDVVEVLGLDAALVGAGAIGGAISGAGAGAGALGALGLAGPPGWILIGVLGLGATAYFAWQAAKKTNDNLEDLIDKLDDLDPGDGVAVAKVEEWKRVLGDFNNTLKLGEVASNPEQMAKVNLQKIDTMQKVLTYLKQVQYEWKQVKPRLTDWGQDDIQAEQALVQTTAAIEATMNQLKQTAKQDAARVISETHAQSGTNYKQLSEEVISLYNQIKQISGQPPVPDDVTEQQALGLARMIVGEKPVTKEQLEQYGPFLLKSKQSLEQLLARLQPKKASDLSISKRVSRVELSKRAWRLATDPPKDKERGQIGGQRRVRDENTVSLQRMINIMNANLRTGAEPIDDDGIYGPRTAMALKQLKDNSEDVANLFERAGITDAMIQQPEVMRSKPVYMQKANSVLKGLVNLPAEQSTEQPSPESSERPTKTRKDTMEVEGILADLETRRDLDDNELLYYINNKMVTNPLTGGRGTIREHINLATRNMPGLVREKYKDIPGTSSAVKLIKQIFFSRGQTAPVEWDLGQLFNALRGGRYGRLF